MDSDYSITSPTYTSQSENWVANNIIIDASNEGDMCEVLGAADVLIMDYSATVVDVTYINIPEFLYVYNLRDYIKDRGRPYVESTNASFFICREYGGLSSTY